MKKTKTIKKKPFLKKISLSTDFPLPATWHEVRIHELMVNQRLIVEEMEQIRLDQLKQQEQITALAGAINKLLELFGKIDETNYRS